MKKVEEVVTFIEKYKSIYTVKLICKVLKFPRSIYYKALLSIPSKRENEAQELRAGILKIWIESKSRYGAPKITKVQ